MKQNDLKGKVDNMKLMDLIPGGHGYDVSKVYEGISSDHPLAKSSFAQIKKTYESIKAEIDRKYSPEAFSGIECVAERMEYILARLEQWIAEDNLYNNQDAAVFMDGFRYRFEEFKTMLTEIDNS